MEDTLRDYTQPPSSNNGQAEVWTVATRAYALACLAVTACFYWPLAILHDWMRAKLPWLAKHLWSEDTNPQTDVDGPEFVLGAPCREFWIYDKTKTGHRGFLPSV